MRAKYIINVMNTGRADNVNVNGGDGIEVVPSGGGLREGRYGGLL